MERAGEDPRPAHGPRPRAALRRGRRTCGPGGPAGAGVLSPPHCPPLARTQRVPKGSPAQSGKDARKQEERLGTLPSAGNVSRPRPRPEGRLPAAAGTPGPAADTTPPGGPRPENKGAPRKRARRSPRGHRTGRAGTKRLLTFRAAPGRVTRVRPFPAAAAARPASPPSPPPPPPAPAFPPPRPCRRRQSTRRPRTSPCRPGPQRSWPRPPSGRPGAPLPGRAPRVCFSRLLRLRQWRRRWPRSLQGLRRRGRQQHRLPLAEASGHAPLEQSGLWLGGLGASQRRFGAAGDDQSEGVERGSPRCVALRPAGRTQIRACDVRGGARPHSFRLFKGRGRAEDAWRAPAAAGCPPPVPGQPLPEPATSSAATPPQFGATSSNARAVPADPRRPCLSPSQIPGLTLPRGLALGFLTPPRPRARWLSAGHWPRQSPPAGEGAMRAAPDPRPRKAQGSRPCLRAGSPPRAPHMAICRTALT